eukprot:290561_1
MNCVRTHRAVCAIVTHHTGSLHQLKNPHKTQPNFVSSYQVTTYSYTYNIQTYPKIIQSKHHQTELLSITPSQYIIMEIDLFLDINEFGACGAALLAELVISFVETKK